MKTQDEAGFFAWTLYRVSATTSEGHKRKDCWQALMVAVLRGLPSPHTLARNEQDHSTDHIWNAW